MYGQQITRRGDAEGQLAVTWEDVPGAFDDGTRYRLRRPRWSLRNLRAGPVDASAISVRVAPPLLGVGLLEASLWRGGEAEASRRAVLAMSAAARDELIAYVRYPFADPLVLGCP